MTERLLLVSAIGAMLPDLIDKPLGQILFYEVFQNNRIFGHTLAFTLLLVVMAYILCRQGKDWLAIIAAGSIVHILLDQMWLWPKTLFWPVFGVTFPTVDLTHHVPQTLYALTHDPRIFVPELLGLFIILALFYLIGFNRYMRGIRFAENADTIGKGDHRVSLIIPTKNEADNIPHVLSKIPAVVDEIVVVDSSTDTTVEEVKKFRPDARIFVKEPNGKGDALKVGFNEATGDILVMIDADGSMNPEEIPLFVNPLLSGYDVTLGSRVLGGSEDLTLLRMFGNFFFVTLTNIFYGTSYTDLCYGYRAFRREAVDRIKFESSGFDVETEQSILVKKLGLRVCEVPSYEGKRIYGTSNLRTFRDGLKILNRIFGHTIRMEV